MLPPFPMEQCWFTIKGVRELGSTFLRFFYDICLYYQHCSMGKRAEVVFFLEKRREIQNATQIAWYSKYFGRHCSS